MTGRKVIPNQSKVVIDDPSDSLHDKNGKVISSEIVSGRIQYDVMLAETNTISRIDEDFVTLLKDYTPVCSAIFRRVKNAPEFKWFTISKDGTGHFWKREPFAIGNDHWCCMAPKSEKKQWRRARGKFDGSNWRNSKIKREME